MNVRAWALSALLAFATVALAAAAADDEARALLQAAQGDLALGRNPAAVEKLERALAAKPGEPLAAEVEGRLGSAYLASGRLADAERSLASAIDRARKTKRPDILAAALIDLGNLRAAQGRFADAQPLYREAATLGDKRLAARAATNLARALADDGRRAAQGEAGELYVRGPAVTYGYWAAQEKTQKMCVPNRFEQNFEEKMYRTGDLVTMAEDGNFYFQGRRDSMIKSRGYRIELGEIESALLSHPGVREAAVLAVPDEIVGNRLRAVVSLLVPDSLKALDLQQHCATRVPKYMIPEFIELCEELPKTSTGKIDRVKLAAEPVLAR